MVASLDEIRNRGHELVSFFQDKITGLFAIVAVHSTVIGPGLGGCRMRRYSSIDEALRDVLNLSEAMSYKNSLCGINFGGGKSVILENFLTDVPRSELFQTFGRCVQAVGGKYITAEDMGTSVADMSSIAAATNYVAGRDPKSGGGGDPSPYTAKGVFEGMKACLERTYSSADFRGRTVAIQGVGHVGEHLARLLAQAGAKLLISDVVKENVERVRQETAATVVAPETIHAETCDIFSPCAVGGTVNPQTIGALRCKMVAGAANNQLSADSVESELKRCGILYAPDFAINAGGVILCADEFEPGGFYESRVLDRVSWIYKTVGMILDQAAQTGETTGEVARRLARERIENARALKARVKRGT